ncbi:MAG: methyl-accepting chemotaxis protein [Gallionellaceae bacterium]
MKASSIANRLILLVIVPLIALAILAGILITQSFTSYVNSVQTNQLMSIAVSAGNLVHTLQVERGATAGFLQSKGQKFADVLPDMRKKTDVQINDFKAHIDSMDKNSLPVLLAAIKDAQSRLEGVNDIRQGSSQLSLSLPEEVAYYSKTIEALIKTMSVGIEFNHDATISKKMIAYLSFVRAKENAGQERALVTAAFTSNKVAAARYRTILKKFNQQDAYLNDFSSIAGLDENASLKAVMAGEATKEVARYRNILMSKATEGGFDVEATVWFKTITAKIEGLHETEGLVVNRIQAAATQLLQTSRTQLITALVICLLAIVLTIIVSFRVAKGISTPLQEMVTFAERAIVENDFSGKIPEHGAAEVVRAGNALNHLISKFRKIIIETKQSSEKITTAAHSLAYSSTEVKDNSLVQSSAAESVAAVVEESSVSISETSANAKAAAELVTHARENSTKAGSVMQETVGKMDGVAKAIRESGDSVQILSESSQKIGNIVQVIKDIADQTNLLALNAAIEAARAGEQGRGFAVVADEVRKLAERTGLATGEIASLIQSIQDEIGATVVSMQQANEHAGVSLELVNQSASALQQIDSDDTEVSGGVQSISDALAEQDAAIRQVAVSIEKIAQMTESNNNAATRNNQTAEELDELALQLTNSVAVFKV